MNQLEKLKVEIEDIKSFKHVIDKKNGQIELLEKRVRNISQERNKLRHQLSAKRAIGNGAIGGNFDSSSSGNDLMKSSNKNVETGESSGGFSRHYEKPF